MEDLYYEDDLGTGFDYDPYYDDPMSDDMEDAGW